MEDWMDRQIEDRENAPRGPRTGFTDPDEEKVKVFNVFHETYLIFRPWTCCRRCYEKIERTPELLPDEGEYTCLHTRHKEYIVLVNRLRNSGINGPIKLSAREITTEKGEIYVTIAWEESETSSIQTQKRTRSIPRL